ncbi:MAG TPA: hypothetical protein VHW23_20305 [Kofleriaceae bacterium]|nr:hypothetical protein [Kofleriaceae bacterium]
MQVSREDLAAAVAQGVITAKQADDLCALWEKRAPSPDGKMPPLVEPPPAAPRPRFDFVHVAYYFGALLVISAMGWFMTLGWERFGGLGIFAIALVYACCFVAAGRTLWHRENLNIPGGLFITMAVCMTPLATYGFLRWTGWWPAADPGNYRGFHEWIKGGWFTMELATIGAGLVALRSYRFPFLVAPVAFVLWYMSMDLAPLLYGTDVTWSDRAWVSAGVGLVMLLVAYLIDRRTRQDFAFWLYLFGLLAFWGGLSSMDSDDELKKFLYLLINLALMASSILLSRRAFMVFGVLGVMGYLGDLSYHVFRDSLAFPFVLSLIGIAIIALGIWYHRHRAGVERGLLGMLPAGMRDHLPIHRRAR